MRPWWRKTARPLEPKPDPLYMRRVVELTEGVLRDSDELRDLVAELRQVLAEEEERG